MPDGEVAVDGLPRREVVGQVTPRSAGAVDVEDGVHDAVQVMFRRATDPPGRGHRPHTVEAVTSAAPSKVLRAVQLPDRGRRLRLYRPPARFPVGGRRRHGKQALGDEDPACVYTPPVVAEGTLFIAGNHDGLIAMHAATGGTLWRRSLSRSTYSTPTVVDGVVYMGSNGRYL